MYPYLQIIHIYRLNLIDNWLELLEPLKTLVLAGTSCSWLEIAGLFDIYDNTEIAFSHTLSVYLQSLAKVMQLKFVILL